MFQILHYSTRILVIPVPRTREGKSRLIFFEIKRLGVGTRIAETQYYDEFLYLKAARYCFEVVERYESEF